MVITNATWNNEENLTTDLNLEVKWFSDTMTAACNQSMPRIKPGRRRAAVWWTDDISGLRQESIRARREYLRTRKNSPE